LFTAEAGESDMTMTSTNMMTAAGRGMQRFFVGGATVAMLLIAGVSAAQVAPQGGAADDPTINGFAVEDAVKPGAPVMFKIQTDAAAFSISVYRFWNGEVADDLVESLPAPAAPQVQPACQTDATGAIDCSNWSVSASWTVPEYTEPGTYYALLRRTDNGGVNHIPFVVSIE
jgi:N,N-dimethylformamidase beta subunit-like protein